MVQAFCYLSGGDNLVKIKAKSQTLPLHINFLGECACYHASVPKFTDIIFNNPISMGLSDKLRYNVCNCLRDESNNITSISYKQSFCIFSIPFSNYARNKDTD